jgi:DNA-directed RNA polymerase subunit RPC12/RpoP
MKVKYQYRNIDINGDFKCIHCRRHITSDPLYSGVINRNHCPYCLHSRHLDLYKAGDRLAACKAAMKPVGLAIKKTNKKYGDEKQGELMLIHLCTDCDRVSINRIAADDIADTLYEIYSHSHCLDAATRSLLNASGVEILSAVDDALVRARLFGCCEGETYQPLYA